MNWTRLSLLGLPLCLVACQAGSGKETIANLRHVQIEIKEEQIEGGLEKAMEGYQRFLEETPDSKLSPEAIRRLADLKVEREYGYLNGATPPDGRVSTAALAAPERAPLPQPSASVPAGAGPAARSASLAEGAKPAGPSAALVGAAAATDERPEVAEELERAGAREAIELYQKLLANYPLYERNDQVLYQMSRAYEELGQSEAAMGVMDQLVRDFPHSRYLDEVQFRRAEYFFTRKRYFDAEEAYKSIVTIGVGSSYFELALYKLGWTFYKQELYAEALQRFIALLDNKVATGYDFSQANNELERKRVDDTFRVISQSFSNLGGADSVVEYFETHGKRSYEDSVYRNLGEFYFDKRRYSDAAASYNAFVKQNPFHRVAPQFHMRIIEIHMAGGFPSLVIEAKKAFARNYGLKAEYWKYFEPSARPEVLGFLKTNFTDLAHHYHALYQDPLLVKDKAAHFQEALLWYEEFLASFPIELESPAINYQLADLLLENQMFARAAGEYEKTAYGYPRHEKASAAGYAAVYAYREELRSVSPEAQDGVKRETVRSSLKFAETFPEHEKAAIVLGAAADDLYELKDYEPALAAARKVIAVFPGTTPEVLRSAWIVVGHSCYELLRYAEAETAYVQVLALLFAADPTRGAFIDNLAASIYKQGEQANALLDYRAAADHFLRVGRMAPTSKIRATAEYDAAAALMQLKDWKQAATVLTGFRSLFPGHPLQPEVTKKLAYLYREDGQLSLAAEEYERVEREFQDEGVRREALTIAAELYQQSNNTARALLVYRRYVGFFPQPIELNLEMRSKVAEILKAQNDQKNYLLELKEIVALDAAAGRARTARTRYLAGTAALVLTEQSYDRFVEVRLVKPFEVNLRKKKELMKATTQAFNKLLDYEVGEVTAAATFYLAEIYAHFSKALTESERPEGLNALELEEYELAIEEQAYPFEEKAIQVHEKNLELIALGIYNAWVDKSLEKLAKFVPARYDKPEAPSGIVAALESYSFGIERPTPPAAPLAAGPEAAAIDSAASAAPDANAVPVLPATPSESPTPQVVPQETETTQPGAAALPPAAGE